MSTSRRDRDCHVERASDGTPVRVQGQIDPELLDRLTVKAHALMASRCGEPSPHPMPPVAQKIHGRGTYTCGRERGHVGEHRWPDEPEARWTW